MKKKFSKIIKSILISSVCVSMLNVTVLADAVGTVKETIKLRSNPFDVGKQISVLYAGDKVQIVDNKQGWYKVCKNGVVLGWASGQYIAVKGTISKSNSANPSKTQKSTTTASTQAKVQKPVAAASTKTKKPAVTASAQAKTQKSTVVAAKPQAEVKKTINEVYATPKTAVVSIGVNVRKSPSTSSNILSSANPGIGFYVLGQSDDWYKVKLANDTIGYIKTSYVSFSSVKVSRGADYNSASKAAVVQAKTAETDKPDQSQATVAQAETSYLSRVLYAKGFIGTPYVYGANGPSSFDCSGFTKYVFAHFGISLERVAADQARQGTYVSKSDLQAGDLVFFDTSGTNNGNICHVGMYIGGGQFIHASSGSVHSVTVSDINSSFYANAFVTARRMN